MPTRSFGAEAKDDKAVAGSEEASKPKRDTVPFNGKIASVDKDAKTFTIGERTFQITAETKIMKAGKAATLGDAVVGEEVGGVAKKSEDGKLMVTSVRFGPKPDAAVQPEKKKE
jgi:hypothetical protein